MSQGGYVTLVGYVAREPNIRQTRHGLVADMRVGTTPRFLDQATGTWRDGKTTYYTVDCWRRLAGHVKASLRKGDPVLVKGRFRTDSYTDKTGVVRTEVRITAETVGHDLSRGIANYMRPERPPAQAVPDPDAADPDRGPDDADPDLGPDADPDLGPDAGADLGPDDAGADLGPDAAGESAGGDLIDEEAIEQFGQELDGLDDAEPGAGPGACGPGAGRGQAGPAPHGVRQAEPADAAAPF
jgi:single-strand DNA-binding protein